MGLFDRKRLLQREKLDIVRVDLGNDDFVYVRQMTGRERDLFEASLIRETINEKGESGVQRTMEDFRAKVATMTMCDEQGNLLLKPDDYSALSQSMSALKLVKIVEEAQKLNRMTEAEKEKLTKNSEGDLVANSTSGSAEN